ncbi:MAG: hypothetical protein PF487_11345, partial [Bacteroidales bacterium]|nr:hypothetical protein [Bacteroidales bacterium]
MKNVKQMKKGILLIIVITSLLFNFCKKKGTNHKLDQGLIKYDIEYLDDSIQDFMVTFLPKKMVIRFKNNNTINKLEGLSGIINFSHIQNYKQKENITLVRILHNKYKYIEEIGKPSIFFSELPNIKIAETGETKEIAG